MTVLLETRHWADIYSFCLEISILLNCFRRHLCGFLFSIVEYLEHTMTSKALKMITHSPLRSASCYLCVTMCVCFSSFFFCMCILTLISQELMRVRSYYPTFLLSSHSPSLNESPQMETKARYQSKTIHFIRSSANWTALCGSTLTAEHLYTFSSSPSLGTYP